MDLIKSSFGQALKEARNQKKLSKVELARKLGISHRTIRSWEKGLTFVENLDIIPRIEYELDISFGSLLEKSIRKHKQPNHENIPEHDKWKPIPLYTEQKFSDHKQKILKNVLVPSYWLPHNAELVIAFQINDSSMSPLIKQGGAVVVDRKQNKANRLLEQLVIIQPADGKLKIRRIEMDTIKNRIVASPVVLKQRNKIDDISKNNDIIIGKVIGIMGQPL